MKRIEAVIAPWALDAFKDAAPKLGISEFDLVEVHRSGCATVEGQRRLYRGSEYTADLPRLRLEFVLFDDDVQSALHQLIELVHPESIAVFKLDQTLSPAKGHLTHSPPSRHTMDHPAQVAIQQIVGSVLRKGDKDADDRSDVALRHHARNGNRGQDQ